jgi:hypothetical protein
MACITGDLAYPPQSRSLQRPFTLGVTIVDQDLPIVCRYVGPKSCRREHSWCTVRDVADASGRRAHNCEAKSDCPTRPVLLKGVLLIRSVLEVVTRLARTPINIVLNNPKRAQLKVKTVSDNRMSASPSGDHYYVTLR